MSQPDGVCDGICDGTFLQVSQHFAWFQFHIVSYIIPPSSSAYIQNHRRHPLFNLEQNIQPGAASRILATKVVVNDS